MVLLESQVSPLSISIAYMVPSSAPGAGQGRVPGPNGLWRTRKLANMAEPSLISRIVKP